jgi:hypothetical protein
LRRLDLTDTWAGNISLPVRPREQAADAAGSQDAGI